MTIRTGILMLALVASATAQDWYHDREARFRAESGRPQVFLQIRNDLDHIWSAANAADKERARIQRTKDELTKMQVDYDGGRWDNGLVNDVIDSLRKSANDDRLDRRDRDVLSDDVIRIKNFQDEHNGKR